MALLDLTLGKVRDESGKLTNPDDYQNAINAALKRYSKHRPLVLVEDLDGNGGHDYDLPAQWRQGASSIVSAEYPVGLVPASYVAIAGFGLYQTPVGQKLRFVTIAPAIGETVRVTYGTLHTEETVPDVDVDAVACLAASICCSQLAAAFGQTCDASMQADVVNYQSKTDEFRRLATFLKDQFKSHLGIRSDDTTSAAMATAPPPRQGRTRLTHGDLQ